MNKNTKLVIPSRGRAKWLSEQRVSTLKQTAFLKPEFWIRYDDDTEAYKDYCTAIDNETRLREYFPTLNGEPILGAAQTYDLIINESIEQGYEYLIILDDDLSFAMHNPMIGHKPDFKLCNERQLEALLGHATSLVDEAMPILSLTPIMARSQPTIVSYCKPMMMAYIYYLPFWKAHPEYRFWMGEGIEARCDLNLSLRLLTQGFLTGFMATLFIPDNVNNPGGCSIYRDIEMEHKSIDFLRKKFPDCTRPRMKKGWVGDPDIMRKAITIQWKKAFNHHKFEAQFDLDPKVYARDKISKYEKTYADFIRAERKTIAETENE